VTYLLAAFFFTLALLGAAVGIHMMVRTHWHEILLALRGEWGTQPRARTAPAAAVYATTRRRAAF
jgi:sirohydrochlorin ferrochelatase